MARDSIYTVNDNGNGSFTHRIIIVNEADALRYLFLISDISLTAHVIDNEIEDFTIELRYRIPAYEEWLAKMFR